MLSIRQDLVEQEENKEFEDLLGTGTILKRVLRQGYQEDIEFTEAPRKFFALINVSVRHNNRTLISECHRDFLISSEGDLFSGVHLAIPLMNVNEKSQYSLDPKFAYSKYGWPKENVPADARIDCTIELMFRVPFDEFMSRLTTGERVRIAQYKRDRGRLWMEAKNIQMATMLYSSLVEVCSWIKQEIPEEIE